MSTAVSIASRCVDAMQAARSAAVNAPPVESSHAAGKPRLARSSLVQDETPAIRRSPAFATFSSRRAASQSAPVAVFTAQSPRALWIRDSYWEAARLMAEAQACGPAARAGVAVAADRQRRRK